MSKNINFLVVVDMQNDFISGALGTPEAQAIVSNVVNKIKAYEHGLVIATEDTHDDGDYFETREGRHLPIEHCVTDHGYHFVTEVYDALKKICNI